MLPTTIFAKANTAVPSHFFGISFEKRIASGRFNDWRSMEGAACACKFAVASSHGTAASSALCDLIYGRACDGWWMPHRWRMNAIGNTHTRATIYETHFIGPTMPP